MIDTHTLTMEWEDVSLHIMESERDGAFLSTVISLRAARGESLGHGMTKGLLDEERRARYQGIKTGGRVVYTPEKVRFLPVCERRKSHSHVATR